MADNSKTTGAKKAQGHEEGTDPNKCAFIIKGPCKGGASYSSENDRSTPDVPGSEHTKPTIMSGSDQDKEKAVSDTTAEGTDRTKCAFSIKGPCKGGASSSFEYDRSTPNAPGSEHMKPSTMSGSDRTGGTIMEDADPTKCAFSIKGPCKGGASSPYEYDRSTPDAPGSEHMKPNVMSGSDQDKEKPTGGTPADEAKPESYQHAGTQIGVEDITILERRLARTLGTDPVPRSQSSTDRMLELQDTWSTQTQRNRDNLVAFRGTKNDVWAAELPVRPRSRSVGSEAQNNSDSHGTTAAAAAPAPATNDQDGNNTPGTTATGPAPAPKEQGPDNIN